MLKVTSLFRNLIWKEQGCLNYVWLVAVTVASARNKITVVRVVVVDCDRRVFSSGVTDLLVISGTSILRSSRVFGMMKRIGTGVSFLELLPCAWGGLLTS